MNVEHQFTFLKFYCMLLLLQKNSRTLQLVVFVTEVRGELNQLTQQ